VKDEANKKISFLVPPPLRESLPRFGGGFRERQKGTGVKMTKKKINIL